ncbi:monocarboxylate transporter 2-like [Ruditapes philippinarum]|uniref:monocarboxylate transporter 2-like n=1 Tax=Ruditapes philippinarum TaxID=129788 RepID=UPI00295B5A92|nr:monocarboxylate transporter 2-like [Ruditapes philippinarum]
MWPYHVAFRLRYTQIFHQFSTTRNLLFVLCVMNAFFELGIVFQFATFYITLLDTFQSGRAKTVAVQSLLGGFTLSLGVLSGVLVTKIGIRWVISISCILVPVGFFASFFATRIEHLYVSLGITAGIGISLSYVSLILLIGRIFIGKKRDLCISLLMASSSLSGVVYPYFIDWLLVQYGLNGSFLILGAVYCNKFPMLVIIWANKTSIDKQSLTPKCEEDKETSNGCTNTKNKFRGDISEWKGFGSNSWRGIFALVIYNVASTISRLIPGLVGQIDSVNPFLIPIISAIIGFIGQLILYVGSSYALFALSVCLSGLAIGGILSSQHILVLKVVRIDFVPIGSGLLITSAGVLNFGIGPLFGSIRDSSGSYGIVVLTISALLATSAVFLTIVLFKRRSSVANGLKKETITISVISVSKTTQN